LFFNNFFHPQTLGHPPTGIYDVPHVHFHFMLVPEEARFSIKAPPLCENMCVPVPNQPPVPLDCETWARLAKKLPADEVTHVPACSP
jgi:hypothetical protein